MCMDRQDTALSAPVLAWAHSTLIKPLQITSDIRPNITCQSFFYFPLRMIWVFWSTCVCVCVCVCVLVCERRHMGTWEQTANLFQHAGCGFYFCLLYPLSYAFSLKVESNLSQHPSFPHTKGHRNTQKFIIMGVNLKNRTFSLIVLSYSAIVVVTW